MKNRNTPVVVVSTVVGLVILALGGVAWYQLTQWSQAISYFGPTGEVHAIAGQNIFLMQCLYVVINLVALAVIAYIAVWFIRRWKRRRDQAHYWKKYEATQQSAQTRRG